MSVSSTVTLVCKVGLFCVIVFIGLTVFRRTSAWSHLSDAWAMRACQHRVQADLDVLLWDKYPEVMSCVGPPVNATCQVKTTEQRGAYSCRSIMREPDVKKTAPLRGWDCTRRHAPEGQAGWVMRAMVEKRPLNATERGIFAEYTARDPRRFDEADTLASSLKVRQALIDP